MKIIDSHCHFWDPGHINYPWIEKGSVFDRAYLLADYKQATADAPIEKLVFVECDGGPANGHKEVEWVEGLSQQDQRIQAIVGHIQFTANKSFDRDLDQMAARPLVRGIRDNIQGHEPGFALQTDYINAVRKIAARDLHIELCITHDQLAETISLVQQCPDARFILNHCGKPAIKDGLKAPWQAEMHELANLPNVVCKISGLLTEADWQNWQQSEVRWYAEATVEAFGISRVLFGSDWPINEAAGTGGFEKWYELVQTLTANWSASDRERFYYLNAKSFYRI